MDEKSRKLMESDEKSRKLMESILEHHNAMLTILDELKQFDPETAKQAQEKEKKDESKKKSIKHEEYFRKWFVLELDKVHAALKALSSEMENYSSLEERDRKLVTNIYSEIIKTLTNIYMVRYELKESSALERANMDINFLRNYNDMGAKKNENNNKNFNKMKDKFTKTDFKEEYIINKNGEKNNTEKKKKESVYIDPYINKFTNNNPDAPPSLPPKFAREESPELSPRLHPLMGAVPGCGCLGCRTQKGKEDFTNKLYKFQDTVTLLILESLGMPTSIETSDLLDAMIAKTSECVISLFMVKFNETEKEAKARFNERMKDIAEKLDSINTNMTKTIKT